MTINIPMFRVKSSIGRKAIMAITGAALVLFLLFHASQSWNMECYADVGLEQQDMVP